MFTVANHDGDIGSRVDILRQTSTGNDSSTTDVLVDFNNAELACDALRHELASLLRAKTVNSKFAKPAIERYGVVLNRFIVEIDMLFKHSDRQKQTVSGSSSRKKKGKSKLSASQSSSETMILSDEKKNNLLSERDLSRRLLFECFCLTEQYVSALNLWDEHPLVFKAVSMRVRLLAVQALCHELRIDDGFSLLQGRLSEIEDRGDLLNVFQLAFTCGRIDFVVALHEPLLEDIGVGDFFKAETIRIVAILLHAWREISFTSEDLIVRLAKTMKVNGEGDKALLDKFVKRVAASVSLDEALPASFRDLRVKIKNQRCDDIVTRTRTSSIPQTRTVLKQLYEFRSLFDLAKALTDSLDGHTVHFYANNISGCVERRISEAGFDTITTSKVRATRAVHSETSLHSQSHEKSSVHIEIPRKVMVLVRRTTARPDEDELPVPTIADFSRFCEAKESVAPTRQWLVWLMMFLAREERCWLSDDNERYREIFHKIGNLTLEWDQILMEEGVDWEMAAFAEVACCDQTSAMNSKLLAMLYEFLVASIVRELHRTSEDGQDVQKLCKLLRGLCVVVESLSKIEETSMTYSPTVISMSECLAQFMKACNKLGDVVVPWRFYAKSFQCDLSTNGLERETKRRQNVEEMLNFNPEKDDSERFISLFKEEYMSEDDTNRPRMEYRYDCEEQKRLGDIFITLTTKNNASLLAIEYLMSVGSSSNVGIATLYAFMMNENLDVVGKEMLQKMHDFALSGLMRSLKLIEEDAMSGLKQLGMTVVILYHCLRLEHLRSVVVAIGDVDDDKSSESSSDGVTEQLPNFIKFLTVVHNWLPVIFEEFDIVAKPSGSSNGEGEHSNNRCLDLSALRSPDCHSLCAAFELSPELSLPHFMLAEMNAFMDRGIRRKYGLCTAEKRLDVAELTRERMLLSCCLFGVAPVARQHKEHVERIVIEKEDGEEENEDKGRKEVAVLRADYEKLALLLGMSDHFTENEWTNATFEEMLAELPQFDSVKTQTISESWALAIARCVGLKAEMNGTTCKPAIDDDEFVSVYVNTESESFDFDIGRMKNCCELLIVYCFLAVDSFVKNQLPWMALRMLTFLDSIKSRALASSANSSCSSLPQCSAQFDEYYIGPARALAWQCLTENEVLDRPSNEVDGIARSRRELRRAGRLVMRAWDEFESCADRLRRNEQVFSSQSWLTLTMESLSFSYDCLSWLRSDASDADDDFRALALNRIDRQIAQCRRTMVVITEGLLTTTDVWLLHYLQGKLQEKRSNWAAAREHYKDALRLLDMAGAKYPSSVTSNSKEEASMCVETYQLTFRIICTIWKQWERSLGGCSEKSSVLLLESLQYWVSNIKYFRNHQILNDGRNDNQLQMRVKIPLECLRALCHLSQVYPGHFMTTYYIVYITYSILSEKTLAQEYFRILSIENNSMEAEEILQSCLFGCIGGAQRIGGAPLPAKGLFEDRKRANVFAGFWRLPHGDIDRCGVFARYVAKSCLLAVSVCSRLTASDNFSCRYVVVLGFLMHTLNHLMTAQNCHSRCLAEEERMIFIRNERGGSVAITTAAGSLYLLEKDRLEICLSVAYGAAKGLLELYRLLMSSNTTDDALWRDFLAVGQQFMRLMTSVVGSNDATGVDAFAAKLRKNVLDWRTLFGEWRKLKSVVDDVGMKLEKIQQTPRGKAMKKSVQAAWKKFEKASVGRERKALEGNTNVVVRAVLNRIVDTISKESL